MQALALTGVQVNLGLIGVALECCQSQVALIGVALELQRRERDRALRKPFSFEFPLHETVDTFHLGWELATS